MPLKRADWVVATRVGKYLTGAKGSANSAAVSTIAG